MSIYIEAAIVKVLKASPEVQTHVGNRIFPHVARQQTPMPYAIYYGTRQVEHELTGDAVGLATMDLTFEIYTDGDDAYRDGKHIVNAFRAAIDGYRNVVTVVPDETVSVNIDIRTCILDTVADQYIPPIDGSEKGRIVNVLNFSVGYLESVPVN